MLLQFLVPLCVIPIPGGAYAAVLLYSHACFFVVKPQTAVDCAVTSPHDCIHLCEQLAVQDNV